MAGHIISVIGGKGGVGKSLFAANLAFAYAQEIRNSVLLLDFDQKACGDQSIITGLKPKKNLKDLADFTGAIDPRSIAPFIATSPQKVSFISMTNDANAAAQISIDGLGKSLKAIPNMFPITIIDIGSELTPLALKGLENSVLIFLVTSHDVLAVNQAKRIYSDLLTQLFPKDAIQVIANFYQKGLPITPELISAQIGKPVFAIIPRDDATCTASLSKSQAAVATQNTTVYARSVVDCVRKLVQKNVLKTLEKLSRPTEQRPKSDTPETAEVLEKKKKLGWLDMKARVLKALVEEMDIKNTSDDKDAKGRIILREQTRKKVVEILDKEDTKGVVDGREEMNKLVKEVLDEALGLGPLEDLLADKAISEIMVNGPHQIYFEKSGKIRLSEVVFTNERQALNVIERIVAPIGRRIDEKVPYVDARLRDGSRVHAIIPPCALNGPTITIRKFPEKVLTYKDLVAFGSMTTEMADFLRVSVEAHRNIVVSGGTGSGKTTLINLLGGFIPANERIITCEDSAELRLPQEHVVRLETKHPSLEGEGGVDIRCLVKQCLRMRPDRIVVGECRGGETLDMLQAMNTGHDGSLTTVHSNNARDCMGRLETLVQYSGAGLTQRAIREMISSAVHMVVQQSRLDDGSRKVIQITELSGIQGEIITLQDIFIFKQEGLNKQGKIVGKFQPTGFIPKFVEVLERKGYKIPRGIFNSG
ncbi:MAG: Flp pilus assembly complex ATPase component TadA [Oligoflexia bacterium]|nr:Flp pilus assembly complex ATPase component TadA [Oligoflexia bacterium]MBF0364768.1 Flp pilus assembly complex ATPase component TadA [Oligoflexia bacterium]